MTMKLTHSVADFSKEEKKDVDTRKEAFEGHWVAFHETGDSPNDFFKAMGVGMIKRQFLKGHVHKNDIKTQDNGNVKNDGFYPAGVKKSIEFKPDGSPFTIVDADAGKMDCKCEVSKGIWLQERVSSKGTMYDNRIVYTTDPSGKGKKNPVMLVRLVWTPDGKKQWTINRWMEKLS